MMKPGIFYLKVSFIIFLCLWPGKAKALIDPDAYNFTYITSDDGLSQNMIDHIYKDSRGFMWFATWNGLNRYDGYRFRQYGIKSGKNTINSLFVHSLVEDNYGYLWVGTEEGLNRIDIFSGEVLSFDSSPFKGHMLFSTLINTLLKDSQGRIWVGFSGGLAVISLGEQGHIASIDLLQEDFQADILALSEDASGKIWIGYRNGRIRIVNPLSEKSFQFTNPPGTLADATLGEIFSLCRDGDNMWIGTDNSLVRYSGSSGTYHTYKNDPSDTHSLLQNHVKDLVIDKDGNLLIATYLGLSCYNREADNFYTIGQENDNNVSSLNNNFVNSLFLDDDGIIWIGTEKGGVNKMVKKEILFTQFRHDINRPSSLSAGPVNSIFQDSRGTLWFGTIEGGLNKYEPAGKGFTHYRNNRHNSHSLSHNSVSYITEGAGWLWIATWGGHINRMRPEREGYFEHLTAHVQNGSFMSDFISWIEYDPVNNGLWIGSQIGLEYYDIEKQTVKPILRDMENGKRIKEVFGLCLDKERRLWVGTGFGLYVLELNETDVEKGEIAAERYRLLPPDVQTPTNEKINCIYEATDGSIWVGTYGFGLAHLQAWEDGTPYFRMYGTEAGLSNNVIYAIEEDDKGNLWTSTDMGLSCFSPAKERAATYYASDGFSTNQFYWVASCHTRDGKLLFGSMDGAISFNPEIREADTTDIAVTLVEGTLHNEKIPSLQLLNGLQLREQDKSFGFEFSALSYVSPEKIRYAYMLEGFNTEWTEVDATRRFANYTSLPAGKYTLQVKCTNPDGEWSDKITTLDIQVIPPFYKRGWFLSLCAALLILAIYYFYEMRMRNLRRQKERLEQMVDERTRKIEEQRDRLAIQSRQIEDATQDKINFFTNIGHEFKTPLTLILGPIEQALKLSENPRVINQLELVRKNSKYLLSLINQLMDFRKAETGSLKVHKRAGHLVDFTRSIVLPFQSISMERDIQLDDYYRLEQPVLDFDHDLAQKLLTNLLSNAGKFTPNGGRITVYTALLPRKGSDWKYLYVSVHDTGPGIPEDIKERIFERFYQVDNQIIYPMHGQSGTGIGLFLCRQIVELLGGQINVKNNHQGGASFRILIPVSPEDLEVEPITEYYQSPEAPDTSDNEDTEIDIDLPPRENKPLLLIVEDNTDMRGYIRSVLEEQFTILEASNGEAGLKKTLKYIPDFIISDIMMPVMDGLEFCKKVKNNFATSHIPILLLTAKSSTPVRIEGYKVGADGYIAKPFDAELLIIRIRNILESRNRLHKAFGNSMDVMTLEMEEESQDKRFLDKLMEVIGENYQDSSFDVGALIEKMHMSKSLLQKKLQSLIGQPAVQIIRTYRLTKAKEILQTKKGAEMNISEIAYEVGFNDPKYFTRCFTKHFGTPPSELNEKK